MKHKFAHESSLMGEPRSGAKEAAVKLREGLKKRGQTLEEAVLGVGIARSDFQNGQVCARSLKVLCVLCGLSQYEAENLLTHQDEFKDGYVRMAGV